MNLSWESLKYATGYCSVCRRGLNPDIKNAVWKSYDFPSVDVPVDCYIWYSTLPDSKYVIIIELQFKWKS